VLVQNAVVGTLTVSAQLSSPPDLGTSATLTLRPLAVASLSDDKLSSIAVKYVLVGLFVPSRLCNLYDATVLACRWPSWMLADPRTIHCAVTHIGSATEGGKFECSASGDTVVFTPEMVARFEAGGEVEFDVFGKRGEDDAIVFLAVASPTPGAQSDAILDRNKLLRYTVNPGTQGVCHAR
jgi:hypothetical protein